MSTALFLVSKNLDDFYLQFLINDQTNYMYKYRRKKELIFKSIDSGFITDAKLCDL